MDEQDASEARALAGRYELGPLLGHGGMGTVHGAVDLRLRRPVAVKILRADLAAQPKARRRFETEAYAAARLVHPNVVTVFDSGEHDGIPFLVMERLPGRTLADEFAAGPVPLERVREVASEILSALAAAHAAGIIHRDIKPGNALLTEDRHVKVSDFGIAKTVDDIDQTQTVELVATPGYLAPERITGEPASRRSDLYSVGVLLYEALAGRRPFAGDTPLAVMRAVEAGHAEPLASLRPGLPADVVAAVARAMSRDPRERFASADEMAAALSPSARLDATVPIASATAAEGEAAPETVRVAFALRDDAIRDGATQKLELPASQAVARQPGRTGARRRLLALVIGTAFVGALVAGAVVSQQHHAHTGASLPSTTTSAPPTTAGRPAPTTTTPPGPGRGHGGNGPGNSKKGEKGSASRGG